MGGGSSVMGMWALRGLPSDYDGWAAGGALGWAWNDVLPYFRKLETDRDINSPEHGRDGPVSIGRVPPEQWPGFVRALAAAGERLQLRLLPDLNSTEVDGVFALPASVTDAGRVSSATAYLTPAVRRRQNLGILAQAEVTQNPVRGSQGRRRPRAPRRRRNGDDPSPRDNRRRWRHPLPGSPDEIRRRAGLTPRRMRRRNRCGLPGAGQQPAKPSFPASRRRGPAARTSRSRDAPIPARLRAHLLPASRRS